MKLSPGDIAVLGDSRLKYAHTQFSFYGIDQPVLQYRRHATFRDIFRMIFQLPLSIKFLILHVGIFDILKSESIQTAFYEFTEMIERILKIWPDINIAISEIAPIGFNHFCQDYQRDYIWNMNSKIYHLNRKMKEFCRHHPNLTMIQHDTIRTNRTSYLARDGLHYNQHGILEVMNNYMSFLNNYNYIGAQQTRNDKMDLANLLYSIDVIDNDRNLLPLEIKNHLQELTSKLKNEIYDEQAPLYLPALRDPEPSNAPTKDIEKTTKSSAKLQSIEKTQTETRDPDLNNGLTKDIVKTNIKTIVKDQPQDKPPTQSYTSIVKTLNVEYSSPQQTNITKETGAKPKRPAILPARIPVTNTHSQPEGQNEKRPTPTPKRSLRSFNLGGERSKN